MPNYSGEEYPFGQENYPYIGPYDAFYQPQLYYPYSQAFQFNGPPESQYNEIETNPCINNDSSFIPVCEPSGNSEYPFPLHYENPRESMSTQDSYSPFSQRSIESSNYSFEMSPSCSGETKTFEFKKESRG